MGGGTSGDRATRSAARSRTASADGVAPPASRSASSSTVTSRAWAGSCSAPARPARRRRRASLDAGGPPATRREGAVVVAHAERGAGVVDELLELSTVERRDPSPQRLQRVVGVADHGRLRGGRAGQVHEQRRQLPERDRVEVVAGHEAGPELGEERIELGAGDRLQLLEDPGP